MFFYLRYSVFLPFGMYVACNLADSSKELRADCDDTDTDTGHGEYLWHSFYGGVEEDEGRSIAVDDNDNIYITGTAQTSWDGPDSQSPLNAHSGGRDIFVIKLDSDGEYQWHTFYGSGGSEDVCSIAVDANANAYVTGRSYGEWKGPNDQEPLNDHFPGGSDDIFILSVDSNGAYQWHTFVGSYYSDEGLSLAVGGEGNLFLTGASYGSWLGPDGQSPLNAHSGDTGGSGNSDIFVLKVDSEGAYQWHAFFGINLGDGVEQSDSGNSLVVSESGDLLVTGYSFGTWDGPGGQSPLNAHAGGEDDDAASDIFILKLTSSGVYQWHTFLGSPYGNGWSLSDYGESIAVTEAGDILVTGGSYRSWDGPNGQSPLNAHAGGQEYGGSSDIFVLQLDATGEYLWHTFFGASDGSIYYFDDSGRSIGTDAAGNIFITGFSSDSWAGPCGQNPLNPISTDGIRDAFVLKLGASGVYQWHAFYGDSSYDEGSSLAVDKTGKVFVTGKSENSWAGTSGQSPLSAHSEDEGMREDIFILGLAR